MGGGVRQVGRDVSQQSACFLSACSPVQPCLNFVFRENENIRADVKWQLYPHSSAILSLGAGQLQNTAHANFSEGKGYFQRMKIDFPLDLCIIKEHNNETKFSLWFPPCRFLTFSRAVY